MSRRLLIFCLFVFGNSGSFYAQAARVVLSLQEISAEQLQNYRKSGLILRDLSPLPWIVVDLPEIIVPQNTRSARISLQTDIKGHFEGSAVPAVENSNPHWQLQMMNVPSVWDKTQGEGIKIALLDSGVDATHPDLAGNILAEQGYNFGDNSTNTADMTGHGTAMAGLMVAHCTRADGSCGVAPQAQVIPYKLNSQDQGSFYSADLAAAILAAAASDAQIISMSLSLDAYAPWVEAALRYAASQGKILVAAAGNGGNAQLNFPANLRFVVSVGAVDKQGKRLFHSNYGDDLLLTAPGTELTTPLPGTGYSQIYSGTSAATALVSGIFALQLRLQPQATPLELIAQALNNSEDYAKEGYSSEYGFGIVKIPTSDNSPLTLWFSGENKWVYQAGENLQLNLSLKQQDEKQGDLYLHLNFPSTQPALRQSLFKIWQNSDSVVKMSYNSPLASPYLFRSDLNLSLFGNPEALFGVGTVLPEMVEGAYELLGTLLFTENIRLQARKIIWITKHR